MIFITGQKDYSLLEYNQEVENVHRQISNQIYFCRKKGQGLLENKESRDVPNKNMKKKLSTKIMNKTHRKLEN